MSRNRREHGRIISVETHTRGDALAADAAAGATSITVEDAGDFDEDGGWLTIGGQVIEFSECDDDTGVILLVDPLTAAAEQGDPVQVWSDLYDEVVDYQQALVELDGEYDNPDPVVAEVAEGVGDLPEGDRGKAGESCTLLRVADDEWEVVGVGGRARKSRGLRAEADDVYTLTAADIAAGVATIPLSHRPVDEWLIAFLAGVPQRPTNYTIDYDAKTITWPLSGWEKAGHVIWVHYAYRTSLGRSVTLVDWQESGWKYLPIGLSDSVDRSAPGFDDSAWSIGPAAFGNAPGHPFGWPNPSSPFPTQAGIWIRHSVDVPPSSFGVAVTVRADNGADVYWNGTLIGSQPQSVAGEFGPLEVPAGIVLEGANTLAIRCLDDVEIGAPDFTYIDCRVTASG